MMARPLWRRSKIVRSPQSMVHGQKNRQPSIVNSRWIKKQPKLKNKEKNKMFKFEKLEVWQKSIEFSFDIHQLTRTFPKEEVYILTSQIKRAADSIALNIAEGSTGQSNPEFKQFINYAIRSAIEVVSCLYVGKKRAIIKEADFKEFYDKAEIIIKMLQALRNSLK